MTERGLTVITLGSFGWAPPSSMDLLYPYFLSDPFFDPHGCSAQGCSPGAGWTSAIAVGCSGGGLQTSSKLLRQLVWSADGCLWPHRREYPTTITHYFLLVTCGPGSVTVQPLEITSCCALPLWGSLSAPPSRVDSGHSSFSPRCSLGSCPCRVVVENCEQPLKY